MMSWYYPYYYSPSERDILKSTIMHIDRDIVDILFNFDEDQLYHFFKAYETIYGKSPANYARRVYPKWRSGEVKYSATSIKKFIELVPRFMKNDERYDLLKKLYLLNRQKDSYTFSLVLGHDESDLKSIQTIFDKLCYKPSTNTLPKEVTQLMTWLCTDDANQARRMMVAIEMDQSKLIARIAKEELERLISAIKILDSSAVGNHTIEMPYGTIHVIVRNPTKSEKIGKYVKNFKRKFL